MKQFITAGGMKRRVLIVEDEIINREILGAMLSQTYEIAFAANGQEAMDALNDPEADFSLILLDLCIKIILCKFYNCHFYTPFELGIIPIFSIPYIL